MDQLGSTQEEVVAAIDRLRARTADRLIDLVGEHTKSAVCAFAEEDGFQTTAELHPPELAGQVYADVVAMAMVHQNVARIAASVAKNGGSPTDALDLILDVVREGIDVGFEVYDQVARETRGS